MRLNPIWIHGTGRVRLAPLFLHVTFGSSGADAVPSMRRALQR